MQSKTWLLYVWQAPRFQHASLLQPRLTLKVVVIPLVACPGTGRERQRERATKGERERQREKERAREEARDGSCVSKGERVRERARGSKSERETERHRDRKREEKAGDRRRGKGSVEVSEEEV